MMSSTKKRYHQSFRDAYSTEFPCIMQSQKGETFAFYSICSCDINIAYGGRTELTNHIKSIKHVSNTKLKDSSRKIDSFFTTSGTDLDVIRAECLFTSFLIEHNIPLAAADHAGALFKKMFPGSEIAKRYGCGRTKTSHILKEMAIDSRNELISCMQREPFTLTTDGSNDSEAKLYPLVVTCFEEKQEKIVSSVLSVPALVGDSTGHNIGNLLISQLEYYKVPIENCIAFCSDNAPVMIGKKNGVAAVLKEAQPYVFVLGCSCHLINLAAQKGASSLPVKIDELLVDIFYYLEKSCKRKERLKKFQELHNKETKKILKHVCTRWLSLGKCLQRLLEQWDPLVGFFKDEVRVSAQCASTSSLTSFTIPKAELGGSKDHGKRKAIESSELVAPKRFAAATKSDTPVLKNKNIIQTREEKLFTFLSSGLNKAFCAFLCAVIPVFENLNSALQSASPQIHKLLELMTNLLQQLLSRFVKPKVIKSSPLQKVQYHLVENQRDNDDLLIGVQAMNLVKKLNDKDRSTFFSSVRASFCSACDYIINKFPLGDEVLKHAKVAEVSKIEDAKFSSVEFLVERFPSLLLRKGSESGEDAMNVLQSQFVALQVDDSATVESETLTDDTKWARLMSIRGADDIPKYDRLSRLMLSVLTLPHSNAECERVFSLVKKNRSQFRSSMSNETLDSISVLKTRSSGPCYMNSFPSEFLTKAKKATHLHLSSSTCDGI